VTAQDANASRGSSAPSPKAAPARYLFGVVVTSVALVATLLVLEAEIGGTEPTYSLLIAAVALTVWYGGFGPSLLAIVFGWGAALWLVVESRGAITLGHNEEMARWWLSLAVAIVIAGVAGVLRLREERSAGEAHSARTAIHEIESLQQLSIELSGAPTIADAARVVSAHAPGILSASGMGMGLVEGEELALLDAGSVPLEVRRDGDRLRLEQTTLLTEAAREGRVAAVADRAAIEAAYGRNAQLLPGGTQAAIAFPLRAQEHVIGSIGFLFDRRDALDDDTQALAGIVADLAAQAFERARLYEVERESRVALERILQVAPRFVSDETEDPIAAIAREARTTFGADYGVLWRIREDDLELLAVDPPRPELSPRNLRLDDFPRLRAAIHDLRSSFVPDVLQTTHGEGLDFVRQLGIRSSLRTPVVISGSSELVLSISWQAVVSEPDPATLAVVRRYADQAGLALEQLERRRAESDLAARADATRRLQEVTASLSQAASSHDVSNTCLEHALASVGAEAGFVVLVGAGGSKVVELVASAGYDDDELAAWRATSLDDDVPFARAIASREPVWALSAAEMSAFTGLREARSAGWVTIPLETSRGARGALHLSLRRPRQLSDREREWLQAMVLQCGQALERSDFYEEEQRSRLRAERLQRMTALLSNALTPADVARVVVDEVAAAVDASAVVLAAAHDGVITGALARHDEDGAAGSASIDAVLDDEKVGMRVLRRRRPTLVRLPDDHGSQYVQDVDGIVGPETLFLVPLVPGRRANGLLVATWDRPRRLASEDRAIVEALAGQAAQALERARLFESEQTIAETLQRSVLPVSLPRVEGVQLAARYLPGTAQLDVGGDWFDALQLPDGKLGLVVGDVVGKGVQAAASMGQLRNAIRAYSVERLKPPSALTRLSRLADEVLDTPFATLVYLAIDPAKGICRMSSAGHPPPVVAYPDGRVVLLEAARGLPLGTGIPTKYRQETIELPAGTVLVLYTDGLVERRGRSIDDGLRDLQVAVLDAPKDPDRLLEHILEHVVGTGEREDDIALLAARLLPVAPRPLELRLAARIESMELVRDAMRSWLGGTPLERSDAEDVVLATWEACANAIEHAADASDDVVTLRAELGDVVRVVVQDTGRWTPPTDRENRGLGLRLIDSLMSSVDISESETGTAITIEKTFPAPTGTGPAD
jgi:serine phosphatase RsbU (regulator of sigma subunit)/anti-sigma regulatory factor (Ser/Thr protein kinase)